MSIVIVGVLLLRKASRNLESYFLGGKTVPFWVLGVSNTSSMFDITGTMWIAVGICAVTSVILKKTWYDRLER